ncbi:Ovarian cancer-associated gene 2 [Grifola frondosa]|uniref:Ovarian cancer-associated gene 2 n=1 Tax=Grifola frondosa TaxID=5627 RepID=A0A1C7LZH3_GRIFR|nr:Ovarian cancer-associated gene 2 [Grifola frondosa]
MIGKQIREKIAFTFNKTVRFIALRFSNLKINTHQTEYHRRMASKQTRKVLMLHGYAQNAAIFAKRMGAVRKACGKDIDLVFVDAPHILTPVDITQAFSTKPEGEDVTAETATETDPTLLPRGWWKIDGARIKSGLEESIAHLRDILKQDHYDGIFGFSQGAAMAAVITALLEKPHLDPSFLIDGKPPHPPLTFCISVAGFRPRSPLCDAVLLPSYSTPTLHVLGRTDVIVLAERSKALVEVATNSRVEYHDGGHFVPSKANWRNFFRDYFRDPLGAVPSPGSAAVSEPPSGAATPTMPTTPGGW